MRDSSSRFRRLYRTIMGSVFGVILSLVTWTTLFGIAILDDASHWKGTLIFFAVALPIGVVPAAVLIFHPQKNGQNYLAANLLATLLPTILSTMEITAWFSLPIWAVVLLFPLILLAWAFIEERFLSRVVNSYVDRFAGPFIEQDVSSRKS